VTAVVWDDLVNTVADKIPRDRYGRPTLSPKGKKTAKAYTRVTTLAETLDDRYNLEKWKQRQVAVGLMLRPDLLALVAAQQNDKGSLDRTCNDAIDAAKGGAAGNTGTALHALTERLERGEDLGHIPEVLRADLDAYRACMDRHGIEVVEVEQFVVCEALEAAGTLDRLMKVQGRLCIGDVKTGAGAIDYGLPSIAIQLAIYANAETSWTPVGGHVDRPVVDRSRAYIIHLPAGTGTCELVEVDIVAGWEAAKTAAWVRSWRKRKDLGRSVSTAADIADFRREWISQRVRALPQGAVDVLARMVADHGSLPRVSVSSDAYLDDWAELLDVVEAEFNVPFGPLDPTKPKTTNRKRNT
jgi:hypothetical protein